MAHNIQETKAYLTAHAKQFAEALVRLVKAPQTPATIRLKAIESALDRIGLPALRASITQVVPATMDLRSLEDTKAELLERQKELTERMEDLQLEPPAKKAAERNERALDQARDASKVLPYSDGPLGDP